MTTFEHAMLGVCGALACGLHKKHGWRLPTVAGVAAVSPDWDGLTILISIQLFDVGHRVWGHNLLIAAVVGALIGVLDAYWDLSGRGYKTLLRLTRQSTDTAETTGNATRPAAIWCTVAMLAALSHLPADLVYSGGHGLTDWNLQLLWPFSTRGFVYPLVRWGDVGATLIFVAGMFGMLRWRGRTQGIAAVTLLSVVLYIVVRGAF
jgi:membrane-bound metal-dependent hydrolase YbcI (DUF457 family)